ncbi:hypothetical protein [Bacillus sp. FJAT-52991]|uniref:Fur-regulated basic protein FbpA n=1 Tax=Bacillus kandeliae TaxID=3129297 RepID=A0ABZ2N7E2_9BACI
MAEKLIFQALDEYRIRKDREFFLIEYREATRKIHELLTEHELQLDY